MRISEIELELDKTRDFICLKVLLSNFMPDIKIEPFTKSEFLLELDLADDLDMARAEKLSNELWDIYRSLDYHLSQERTRKEKILRR